MFSTDTPAAAQPGTQSTASDLEVIAKVMAGDTALFELLVRRYNSLLYRIARTYGLNHEDAQDLMQETHCQAFCQLKNFRADASYKTWLVKIALHQCYHKLHYGYLKYEQPDSELITRQDTVMDTGSGRRADGALINKELAKVLEACLQALPLIYRNVFLLREMEDFNVAETAELLGITNVNVKVRLHRAKLLLRKQLEGYYSSADIYEFNLKYCDKIVEGVFRRIEQNR
jgi:RNA polymerase sigma-70 factor (ECF subfamily)